MATLRETLDSISVALTSVRATLDRCHAAPFDNSARHGRLREFAAKRQAIEEETDRIQAELRQKLYEPVREEQLRIDGLEARRDKARNVLTLQKMELKNLASSTPKVDGPVPEPSELEGFSDWHSETEVLKRAVEELEPEYKRLSDSVTLARSRLTGLQKSADEKIARVYASSPIQEALELERRALDLLDACGAFERDISTATETKLSAINAQLAVDATDFSDAEKRHGRLAWIMLAATLALLMVALLSIFFLFIYPLKPAVPPGLSSLEAVLLLFSGRLAILLFFAASLRFLAGMHRVHAEQAVIYRDRKAGLGIAAHLLNTGPLDQKGAALKSLSSAYLSIGTSAFSQGSPQRDGRARHLDAEIKRFKRTVLALRPVLDCVQSAVKGSRS